MSSKFKFNIRKLPNSIANRISDLIRISKSDSKVLVGLPADSNDYPDGTSVILVGATHEFGSESQGIPERSFLRSTIHENRRVYVLMMRTLAKKLIKGEITASKAMGLLGLKASSDVQQKIVSLKLPPNTLDTIKAKKSSNPLIDTGHLRQSITYEVK